jgi:hypothetical protein
VKPPKAPKEKASIQKITERLWKDSQAEPKAVSKKAQKAEAKRRRKELAREQAAMFPEDQDSKSL